MISFFSSALSSALSSAFISAFNSALKLAFESLLDSMSILGKLEGKPLLILFNTELFICKTLLIWFL